MRPPISSRQTQLAWRAPYNIHRGKISTKEKCDSVRGGVTTAIPPDPLNRSSWNFLWVFLGIKCNFCVHEICQLGFCELLSIFSEKFQKLKILWFLDFLAKNKQKLEKNIFSKNLSRFAKKRIEPVDVNPIGLVGTRSNHYTILPINIIAVRVTKFAPSVPTVYFVD